MKFIVDIECDNDAFVGGDRDAELARILRDLADSIERHSGEGTTPLSDINGNRVGKAVLHE